jgi:hypothetical protein
MRSDELAFSQEVEGTASELRRRQETLLAILGQERTPIYTVQGRQYVH